MTYTNEEIAVMNMHTKRIEDWIRENIVPFSRENIKVGFGGPYRSQCGESTSSYTLVVEGDYIALGVRFGYANKVIGDIKNIKGYHAPNYSPVYGNPYNMYPLISNWAEVKRLLLKALEDQRKHISAITNFEV